MEQNRRHTFPLVCFNMLLESLIIPWLGNTRKWKHEQLGNLPSEIYPCPSVFLFYLHFSNAFSLLLYWILHTLPILFISLFLPPTSAIALLEQLEMHRQYSRQRPFPVHFIPLTYVSLCYVGCLFSRDTTTHPGGSKSKTRVLSNCPADVNLFPTVS